MSEHKDLIVIKPKSQLPMVVEENGIYAYLEQIKRFPVLTEDEEKKLITDFQTKGDLLAAQKLITSHLAPGCQDCADLPPLRAADV